MTTLTRPPSGGKDDLSIASGAFIFLADLQAGIADLPLTLPIQRLRRGVRALLELGEIFGLPVIITAVPGNDGQVSKLIDEVEAVRSSSLFLVRTTPNSFNDAQVVAAIQRTGRNTMLISGVATEVAVQLPALAAAAAGLDVHVLTDACGGISPRTEDAALRRMSQAGVKISSLPTLIGELAGDFTKPKGQKAIGVLFELASG
jgi:isochorismate hydrolase